MPRPVLAAQRWMRVILAGAALMNARSPCHLGNRLPGGAQLQPFPPSANISEPYSMQSTEAEETDEG